jgi:hypothetical protein
MAGPELTNASKPSGNGGFRLNENKGVLAIFTPGAAAVSIQTTMGLSDAWPFTALIVEVPPGNTNKPGQIVEGVTFNALAKVQLERASKANQAIVGVIDQGEAMPGKSAPWVINEASPTELKLAQEMWTKSRIPF